MPASWTAPNETLTTNISGQINIFEAIRTLRLDPVVQIACSSEQYGLVLPHETPIKESNPLRPLSSYAVSKVAQDLLGYQYFQSYGLKAIRTRGFNHTGPRRGQVFVTSNFASQVAAIVKKSGVKEGTVLVSAMHITAGVYVNDWEEGLIDDFQAWLETLAPSGLDYRHHQTGEDNADAHLKRTIMGHQVVLPITSGKLDLGPWEQVFYAEFDGQRRKRVVVKVMGI